MDHTTSARPLVARPLAPAATFTSHFDSLAEEQVALVELLNTAKEQAQHIAGQRAAKQVMSSKTFKRLERDKKKMYHEKDPKKKREMQLAMQQKLVAELTPELPSVGAEEPIERHVQVYVEACTAPSQAASSAIAAPPQV